MEIVERALAATYSRLEQAYWHRTYERFRQRYDVDPNFRFNGYHAELAGDGRISLGPGSYIGAGTALLAWGANISVGSDCRVSHYVRFYVSSTGPSGERVGDIVVGDRVLIGLHSYIGPGVSIGDDAAIGANCVVTRDVPTGAVVRSAMF